MNPRRDRSAHAQADELLTDVGAWELSGPTQPPIAPPGPSAGNVGPLVAYSGRFRDAINDIRISRWTARAERREGTR